MKTLLAIAASISMLFLSGCGPEMIAAKGFSLPDGDPEAGRVVYKAMLCHHCHSLPDFDKADVTEDSDISVNLGGEVSKIKSYGELVTSIINPSHKIASNYESEQVTVNGESKMLNYNDVMTVTELINLVSFMQSQYQLRPYEPTSYGIYYP